VPSVPEVLFSFESLLRSVDHTATSTTKYRDFERFLAGLLGIAPEIIYTTHVAKPGNFDVRMTQSVRARNAWLRVALLPEESHLGFVVDLARRIAQDRSPGTAVLLVCDGPDGWRPRWGVEPAPGGPSSVRSGHLARLQGLVPEFRLETYPYTPAEPEPQPSGGQPVAEEEKGGPTRRPRIPITTIPLILDPRIRRMLRNAVASSKAIMLVGPPGTGKSTLVEEMVSETAENPEAYGLSYAHDLSVVTPDESWTARELVGGVSVNFEGQLEFAPGHVLQAIAADQWLLLDEANRADLDKIFGGILTWLAGQEVTIGRESPGSSTEIILTWSKQARSGVQELNPGDGRPAATVYSAGQEWRLLGTYNSLDAHRVFRLGLALGRRFAQIPVPPPSAELFREIAQERMKDQLPGDVGQQVADTIARIYQIHADSGAVALGPALFFSIPAYVQAGLNSGAPGDVDELIAEAYLSAFGTWLVRLEEETLTEFGGPISQPGALGSQWDWVRDQLRHLA